MAARITHEHFGPVVIIRIGTGGNFHRALPVRFDKSLVAPMHIRRIFCTHITATPPQFIAKAKIRQLPRLITAIFTAFIGEAGMGIGRHILHPIGDFLRASIADVS